MAALPNRARVHMGQPPKGAAAPTLPSPGTRAGEATNTSPGRNRSRNRNPGPTQDLDRSRTVLNHNIQAFYRFL
jgi:hypothetical protein